MHTFIHPTHQAYLEAAAIDKKAERIHLVITANAIFTQIAQTLYEGYPEILAGSDSEKKEEIDYSIEQNVRSMEKLDYDKIIATELKEEAELIREVKEDNPSLTDEEAYKEAMVPREVMHADYQWPSYGETREQRVTRIFNAKLTHLIHFFIKHWQDEKIQERAEIMEDD